MSKKLDEIVSKQAEYIPKSACVPYIPIAFERGQGALLYDCDGNEYIDFLASASSANIGHSNPEIAKAVYDQMLQLPQYTSVYFPSPNMLKLAEKLSTLSGKPDMLVSFTCTGSASMDGAIKYVRGYSGRPKIISFSESYHGSTYGSISISCLTNNMRRRIGPLLPECEKFNYPICLRCHYHQKCETCHLECLEEIKYAFDHYIPAEEVAAFVIEPLAGDAGIIVPPKKFLQGLADLAHEHGILLVSDEINQGCGRTGKFFAMDNFDVDCDLYVMGKSIGGGLPLGAVIGRREIMQALDAPAHLFTMSGHATCCAAGLKMLEIMERDHVFEESYKKGCYLQNKFLELQEKYDIIGGVHGIGLNMGVEIVTDRKTMNRNIEATAKICYYCMTHGLVLVFLSQSILRVQPPLIITYEEIDRGFKIIQDAFAAYAAGELGDDILEKCQGW